MTLGGIGSDSVVRVVGLPRASPSLGTEEGGGEFRGSEPLKSSIGSSMATEPYID